MKLTGTLLIVDDDSALLENCRAWFELAGYAVQTAFSGHQALEILKASAVDVLIADYIMPGMNGIELIEQALKAQPYLQTIIFTAHGDLESAKKAIELGVRGYVEKENALRQEGGSEVMFLPKGQLSNLENLQAHVNRLIRSSARYLIVSAMNNALWLWEKAVREKSGHYSRSGYKADFAESSQLWSVQNENGVLRTRGLDRYLDIRKLPARPNKNLVMRSVKFAMDNFTTSAPELTAKLKTDLEQLEWVTALL